jgi:1-acyl-sn-glycerol-3-phosphate acyltransferase
VSPAGSRLRVLVRAAAFLLTCLLLFPTYALVRALQPRWARRIQVLWCRWCLAICGLDVQVIGTPRDDGATLYVANHVSYLDIPVMGAFVNATFVAKAEVGRWPLFGTAARITRTILINRVGAESLAQRQEMLTRLAGGENLMLFAEGTTSDGTAVLPFKSSLFSIAEQLPAEHGLHVQPIAVSYVRLRDGTPLTGPLRALYCWYGNADLMPHLTRVMGLPGATVELRFHAPIPAANIDRKQLARLSERAVAEGVAASRGSPAADAADAQAAAPEVTPAPPAVSA